MRIKNILLFLCYAGIPLATFSQPLTCQASRQANAMAPIYYSAENLRSDTFDILKYTINLEVGDLSGPSIKGSTFVRFAPKINNRTFIRLDLLKLIIDSVRENTQTLTYTYNDTILKVNFPLAKNTNDTSIIRIYYHGQPQTDASGWGGFYFDNSQGAQYAFNLGVGFAAKPHNYGRVWFPCFDNFVERCPYEFNIVTDTSRRAYCNGQLTGDVVSAGKRTRTWILNEEIPTYLACVSVAKYTQVNWTVNTLNGMKPITLVGHPSDTSGMKAGFLNLKSCITGFENYFGPYKWNRFGYCLVPFNSGAMEHATSITYPRSAIGSLAFEELMSHELSHHWWGNLVTCETQEDMWINEGFATFSAYMFYEWQYGKNSYLSKVKSQHDNLLHFLHKNEGGFRAVSGVPHSLTYGSHVYKKGADVAHTLRGYLGDSLFFAGLKYVLAQKSFQSINSTEFRNLLATGTGVNMNDFFNDWVMNGGWSHFAVDSVKYVQQAGGSFLAIVSVRQKVYGAPALHNNVPLELSFFNSAWNRVIRKINMSGASATFTLNIPFAAAYCALNYDSKINDATSHEYKTIKSVGNVNYALGKVFMQVMDKGADSSLVRVVYNYVKPDPFKNNPEGHKLSDQHYWKIEGLFSPGFSARCRFNYDGNKGLSGTNAYMDTLLAIVNGDSIALFYRQNASDDWKWLKNGIKTKIGTRTGFIEIDSLKAGEYTFANLGDTSATRLKELANDEMIVNLFPNPAKGLCYITLNTEPEEETIMNITNIEGRIVLNKRISSRSNEIDISEYAKGTYIVDLRTENRLMFSGKIVVD
jgi:hypothetical protein